MTVSFKDFIDSAKNLLQGVDEIAYRNAASRAYYAAFHEAKRVSKQSNGNIGRKKGSHQQLCNKLKTHTGSNKMDSTIREIGVNLAMCKTERVRADYKIDKDYFLTDAKKTIQQTEKIIILSANIP